jgi:hypothetical protein
MKTVNEPKIIDGIRVVQDENEIAEALKNNETVYHWEAGNSMEPLINHMEYCKIVPCVPIDVKRGDAVFCKMVTETGEPYYMVHQVWEIADCGHDHRKWFKIGSTGTQVFGWSCDVLGKAYGTDIYQEITPEIMNEWKYVESTWK